MYDYTDDEPEVSSALDERERFRAVMSSPAYKGREAAAQTMLFDTTMDADAIVACLQSLPAAAAPKAGNTGDGGRGLFGLSIIGSAPAKSAHVINAAEIYRARRQAAIASDAQPAAAEASDVYANRRRATGA